MLETMGVRRERLALLTRFVREVFPEVERELARWRERIALAGDRELAIQGVASIQKKRFHCLGGSVYALMQEQAETAPLVRLIVAFQTISDYLDNLCDRSGCLDTECFRQLHLAFTGALDPDQGQADYYALFPYHDDNGYLNALVETCHGVLRQLPSYSIVKTDLLRLASLYCDLQTFKHTYLPMRERLLQEWFESYTEGCHPDLDWWEFAAATGSTLGIFALFAAAGKPGLTAGEARQLTDCYFPWISGLHILLDYFIDQEEDRQGGDLNFVGYYNSVDYCRERLVYFVEQSLKCSAELPQPRFHRTVMEGLPAFYLSDPKVESQGLEETARYILTAAGKESFSMQRACRLLRRLGKI